MRSKHCIVVALMAGLGVAMTAQVESVGDRLHKGIYQEETVGDLDAAMKIYQEIVADEKANRPHAAQAKYRLGMCHVKKGEKEEAIATFEELIKEFPGQAKLLEQARGQLAALGHAPESEEPAGVELRETWLFSGLDDLDVVAISRDGRYCAFPHSESGDLVVRDLTTRKDTRAAETMGYYIDTIAISPDGKCVAYTGGCNDVRVVGIDGSQNRVLYPNEEKSRIILCEWSPDGQHVLAVSYDAGGRPVGRSSDPVRIVTISLADGSAKVLKALTPEENGFPTPAFSPDGRYVAYGRVVDTASDQEDIFLIPLDGGPEIPLVESPAADGVLGWLPDGKRFLFRSDRRGERAWHGTREDAWMIHVVDGKPQGSPRLVKKGLPTLVGGGPFRFWGPVRTPTGGWAFYCRQWRVASGTCWGIYLAPLDLDAGKLLKAPMPVLEAPGSGERATSLDFSRDGKYLAYYVSGALKQSPKGFWYGPGKIVIRSLETGQEREITLSPKFGTLGGSAWLRWAPDGRSVLVLGCTEELSRGIHRVDLDSGKLTPVVLEPEQTITDWQLVFTKGRVEGDSVGRGELAPDGKTLFFIRGHFDPNAPRGRQGAGLRIVARDLETDQEREIYRNPDGVFDLLFFAVSPDGQRVFVASKTMLKVFPTAGGEPCELGEKEPSARFDWTSVTPSTVAWTPDSRHLLFGSRAQLWRISADGGQPERVGEFLSALDTEVYKLLAPRADSSFPSTHRVRVYPLRLHPDGRQIAFHAWRWQKLGRVRMMHIVVSDELAKEMCAANLRTIGEALQWYKNDHDDVPDGFADLYPDYLKDLNLLVCPADQRGGKDRDTFSTMGLPSTMRCSYGYEFGPGTRGVTVWNVPLPVDFPAREGMTFKDARKLQLEYFGPVLPVARCGRHSASVYLGYDGEVYESIKSWGKTPQAKAGLLSRLRSAMQSEPATWAQRYDLQRFHCFLEDEGALTTLLKTHLKEHPEDKKASEFLADVPRLRYGCDDAEENVNNGSVRLWSNDLELIHCADPQERTDPRADPNEGEDRVVGIRFPDIPVPQGARIKRAYLQLTAYPDDPGSEKTDLVLHAELAANAKAFADAEHNITSRRKTAASVKWSPEPWTVGGERSEKQRTPDLASLVQEVVNQPDWQEGNALVLIISGSGRRNAQSCDGGWSGTPMLYVEH